MSSVNARTCLFLAAGASLLVISAFFSAGCLSSRGIRDCRVCRIEIGEWDDDLFVNKSEGVIYTNIASKEGVEKVESLVRAGETNTGFYGLVGHWAHLRFIGSDNNVKSVITINADGGIVVMRSREDAEYLPFHNPKLNQYVFEMLLSAAPKMIEQIEQQWVDLTGTNYIRDVFYPDVYRLREARRLESDR